MIKNFRNLKKEEIITFLKLKDKTLSDSDISKLSFLSENVIGHFELPYSIVPNCLVNNKIYHIPMVTEESSVVAACSKAFKFWNQYGGFKYKVLNNKKYGTIYFEGEIPDFNEIIKSKKIQNLNNSMKKRNEGIGQFSLSNINGIHKFKLEYTSGEAMGANFINSILEEISEMMPNNIIMSILTNNYENCIVEVECSADIDKISYNGLEKMDFAEKFKKAIDLACLDYDRAITHNKGIMNGIDAVLIATANDFRAVEASVHAFASKNSYRSLSFCEIKNNKLIFKMKIPLAIATVGGATTAHPMAQVSLDILKIKEVSELMGVIASVGLAQNFAAVSSLISTGIQWGHMRLHLKNMLENYNLNKNEKEKAIEYFSKKKVSKYDLDEFLSKIKED